MSRKGTVEDSLRMLTYLMDELSEPMYKNAKWTSKGWLCTTSTQAVSCNKIETERRKLIDILERESMKWWKSLLNRFHIWRLHINMYDCLNDKFCFDISWQAPGYWVPIDDPRAQRAIMDDPVLSKHVDEDGHVS